MISGGIRSSRWASPGLDMTNGTIGSDLVNELQRHRIRFPFPKQLTHEQERAPTPGKDMPGRRPSASQKDLPGRGPLRRPPR